MPKRQRTPEEVEAIKERILRQAVDLMNRVGFQEFSMRRLAREIKVTPPTLYSYFHDKDELYLCILTEGFSRLYDLVLKAYGSSAKPLERMKAIARAYMDFGLNCAHFTTSCSPGTCPNTTTTSVPAWSLRPRSNSRPPCRSPA